MPTGTLIVILLAFVLLFVAIAIAVAMGVVVWGIASMLNPAEWVLKLAIELLWKKAAEFLKKHSFDKREEHRSRIIRPTASEISQCSYRQRQRPDYWTLQESIAPKPFVEAVDRGFISRLFSPLSRAYSKLLARFRSPRPPA